MSDLLTETPVKVEDNKIDYYKLGLLVNEKGPELSGDITLEALTNWRNEDIVTRANRFEQSIKKIDKPPVEWVNFLRSFNIREQRMILWALGAAFRSGIVNLQQIREMPQGLLAIQKQNNHRKIGYPKAEFLKNAFSVSKITSAASY